MFVRDPITYFTNGSEKIARADLELYLGVSGRTPYTGAHFEALLGTDADAITSDDLAAITMLSVTVPPQAAWELLRDEASAIRDHLNCIPHNATVWERPDLLSQQGAAASLWRLLKTKRGVGRTIASKLLAAKRPHLIPIWDQHVGHALYAPDVADYWAPWAALAADPSRVEGLRSRIRELRAVVPESAGMSDLRLLDVVVWMATHGRAATAPEQDRPEEGN